MPKGLFEGYELLRGSGKKLGLWVHVLEGVSSLLIFQLPQVEISSHNTPLP